MTGALSPPHPRRAASPSLQASLHEGEEGAWGAWGGGGDDDDGDDDGDDNEGTGWDDKENSLLSEIGAGSASLSAQLARIEALAEDLEEDFARTGTELNDFKRALDEGLKEVRGRARSKQ